jgi:ribulose-5-phosphate 4-epimerase/fuculose-1-phosphate aldolase
MKEHDVRADIVRWGRSLFERGLTSGSSGNISVKLADGFLATPTNSCLGFLEAGRLSKLDPDGGIVSGDPPTKELPLHLAFYHSRKNVGAVVHLHSTFATALSCLADVPAEDAIPPITPYVVMRAGRVPLVPYTRPGSDAVYPLIAARAGDHGAALLANHGPVATGASLAAAIYAIEEIEEAAKLVILTRHMNVRLLDAASIAELTAWFGAK